VKQSVEKIKLKQKTFYQIYLSALIWLVFCFVSIFAVVFPNFRFERSEELLNQFRVQNEQQIKLFQYANKNIPSKSKIININLAQKDELTQLPGVGEKIAIRIIRYRDKHTKIFSISELKKIKGIGRKKLEKIKEKITL